MIEDDAHHRDLTARAFNSEPCQFRISVAGTLRQAREILARDPASLIIADWNLPDGKGIAILERDSEGRVQTPLVIMTGYGDEELAVEVMKSGAIGYIVKTATTFRELPRVATHTLQEWESIMQRKRAEAVALDAKKRLADIIGFLPDAVVAIDSEGRVIAWNRAIEEMTGVAAAEMIGKGNYEYSIPFYGERRPILIDLVMMDNAEIKKKYDYIRLDGDRITSETFIPAMYGGQGAYLWGTASPLYDTQGNRTGAIEVIRDITERKNTANALAKSESRFRTISALTSDFAYSCIRTSDEAFSIDWITGSCQRITGYPEEEILAVGCWRCIVTDEDLPVFDENIATLRPGRSSRCELRIQRKDGEVIWLRCFAECNEDPDRHGVFRLYGGCQDITDQKRAEDFLRESEKNLARAQEIGHIGSWEWDPVNNSLAWSEEMYRIFGVPRSFPLTYENIASRIHPDDREQNDRIVKELLASGTGTEFEFRVLRPDGTVRFVTQKIELARDSRGDPCRLFGIIRDITGEREAETALAESEGRYRFLLENMQDIIWQTKPDLTFTYVSPAAEVMTGYSARDLVGTSLFDLLTESSAGRVRERLQDRLHEFSQGSTDLSTVFEVEIRCRDGSTRWFEVSSNPVIGPGPSLAGFQGITRDIAQRKQAEQALFESETRFRELFHSMNSGVAIYEAVAGGDDFIIRDINRAVERIENIHKEEVIGHSVREIFPGIEEFGLFAVFQRVARTGNPESYPVSLYKDNRISGWRENVVYRLPSGEIVAIYDDVTEKRQAEEKLRESESKARTLMNIPALGAFIIDNKGILFDANDTVLKGYGRSHEEILGRPVWDLFSPTVVERRRAWVEEAVRTRMAVRHEDEHAGRCHDVLITPLADDRGEITRLAVLAFDITALKNAQKLLAESEERYRSLMDHLPDYVIVHRDGILLYVNPSAAERMGYDPEALVGRPILPLIDPAYHDTIQKSIARRMGGKDLPSYEIQIIAKDDTRRTVLVNGVMIQYDGGPASLNVLTDITLLRKAEEIRRAYELRLDTAMEIGSLAWWEMSLPDGAVRFDDRKAGMLGYTPERFHHYADFTALLHTEDYEPAMQAMRDHLDGKEGRYHADYRIRAADGGYRWFRDVGGITRRHPDGTPATITGIVIDITAAKTVEEELKRSERFLRQTQKVTKVGGWELDVGTGTIRWTDEVYDIYGVGREFNPSDIATDLSFYEPKSRKILEDALHEATEKGTPYDLELAFESADGTKKWVRTTAQTERRDGRIVRVYGNLLDITDLKLAELAIRESETRFRALIQNSSDIIRILDADGIVRYESPSATRILGYPDGYLIGRSAMDLVHPADRERVQAEFSLVVAKENAGTPTEFRIRKADGEYLWVDAIGINLLGIAGVDGIVITTRPIQQRKEAELALHESEERLRLALEGADIASWDWDLKTGNAVFSDKYYTMLGYEPGEFPATYEGWVAHIHPNDRERVLPDLKRQIEEKRPLCEIEYRALTKDGNWIWILGRGMIAGLDERGDPARLTGVNIDITNRRLMESEIRSLNAVLEQRVKDRTAELMKANAELEGENSQRILAEKQLKASVDEKTMLIKEVHHRVKNNLQIIASLLNLQSRYIKDEQTLAAIRESQNRVRAMALVHEKLYKSENISRIDLHDYIRFLGTGLFQFYGAKSRGIRFTLDIRDIELGINAAIPLGLILNELISNSLKYAFPEGRSGEIAVTITRADKTLSVLFRDNGIGIPPDLDWRNTQSLGLRLVNTLTDQMNGTVELDRTSGTRFSFTVQEKEEP